MMDKQQTDEMPMSELLKMSEKFHENGIPVPMCKILVTNITSDKLVQHTADIALHHIICDHTVEESGSVRKEECMICSTAEYESIMKNGWYEIENWGKMAKMNETLGIMR